MVQVHLGPPTPFGGVAQLGERLPCTQEVIGSIPVTSTIDTGRYVFFIELESSKLIIVFHFNEANMLYVL